VKVKIGNIQYEVAAGANDWFWQRVNSGTWEVETFRAFDQNVGKETMAIDIGAWIGATTLYLAQIAKNVIAFEPDPVAFEELKKNLALNPQISNVVAVNAAVAEQKGSVKLGIRDRAGDSSSSLMLASNEGWSVEAVSLRDVIREGGHKPFLKIDVEGYEFSLASSLAQGLKESGGSVLLALHPHFFGVARAAKLRGGGHKLIGSLAKRTIGRYEGFRAVRDLAATFEKDFVVKDLDGSLLDLKARAKRAFVGRNVTDSGTILITPKI
jgi:FkbM family methyltransferase